jgi:hypothetical protein
MTLGRSKAAKSRKVEISFHSDNVTGSNAHPAICVKVQNLPWAETSEEARAAAYDQAVEEFWYSANLIAQGHGYSGVFPEGRSNGWLVPYTQHDSAGELVTHWTGQGPDKGYPRYPNMEDAKQRRRFVGFRAAIESLIQSSKNRYYDLAMDAAEVQQ